MRKAWESIVWGHTSLDTSDKSWESGGAEKVAVGKKLRRHSDAKTLGQPTILPVHLSETIVFCLFDAYISYNQDFSHIIFSGFKKTKKKTDDGDGTLELPEAPR